jgi:hypothetical protein
LHHNVDKSLVDQCLGGEVFNGSLDLGQLLLRVVGVAAKTPCIGARGSHDVLVDVPQSFEGEPLVLTWPAVALGTVACEGLDVWSALALRATTTRGRSGSGTAVRS